MSVLQGKTVLVGISGGIAAYKTCELVSRLVQNGARVHVAMTKNATEFVAPLTFEALSRNRVTVDTFDRNFSWEIEHVSLAKKADAVIIAPATANVIAKLACGIADDFLTTTVLACTCPVFFAPAMNTAMLRNAATVNNIRTLAGRGYTPIYGGDGRLACGDSGSGRMAEPAELYAALERLYCKKTDLCGKTVLVTSGATRADIDPVRFIANRSSGKTGYAIARAAYERGANVVYICGYTDKFDVPRDKWRVEEVKTTVEMFDAVKRYTASADILIMAAAPCDYEITPAGNKIKSSSFSLELKKAPDCAAWAGAHKKNSKLVIFAAETTDCETNALGKLEAKHADLVVLNDVTQPGAGFDVDTNIVTLITASGEKTRLAIMQKRELADVILDKALSL